jgi:GTP diphosphokinase / guanosine-3',5'-bis(diphosphate) 3'-diphosphatase
MSDVKEITTAVLKYLPNADVQFIEKAFNFAATGHKGQKRKSGEPFMEHPFEVAKIITQLKMDVPSICTAFLHDILEDTTSSYQSIEKEFGKEIVFLVDALTKLSKISFVSKHERQAENFRKMLLAMSKDIRVILIKLSDRLHNMRTLKHLSEEKQREIAQETLDIYAPLANRLGISWMKTELEDLSLLHLKPPVYYKLIENINSTKKERQRYIEKTIERINEILIGRGIRADIQGRHKHLYSIHKKMEYRKLDFEQINDILAFRIIVDSVPECYGALGIIHSLWKPVPGRFKDYIALPKPNLYQSLHTTVIGTDGERLEVQIRTRKMHEVAEEGIAAHWVYKAGEKFDIKEIEKFSWIKQMLDWQSDMKDSDEFYEALKLDLFADEVYVFTPRGDVKEFPRGATPIDFAYRIHTEVGHHCAGAKVNGKIVPLKYKLQNGDTIEVITSENQKPSKDWLKIAITSNAKSKIRSVIKGEQREMAKKVGYEILESDIKKHGGNLSKLLKDGTLKNVALKLEYSTPEELMLAVGYGKETTEALLKELYPVEKPLVEGQVKETSFLTNIISRFAGKQRTAIKVGGVEDVLIRYGKCCNPLPGDEIIGFVTRGKGVTVHSVNCYKILEVESARKVSVEWDKSHKAKTRNTTIRVLSDDRPGILANVSKTIAQSGANISNASIRTTRDRKGIFTFEVAIENTSQLYDLIKSIQKIGGVISVERHKG